MTSTRDHLEMLTSLIEMQAPVKDLDTCAAIARVHLREQEHVWTVKRVGEFCKVFSQKEDASIHLKQMALARGLVPTVRIRDNGIEITIGTNIYLVHKQVIR